MGFKRNNNAIDSILEQNHKSQQVVATVASTNATIKRQKKVRETTRPYNFTLRPSVREKLNVLRDYDELSGSTSAAGYLSDLIEYRYAELNLDDVKG